MLKILGENQNDETVIYCNLFFLLTSLNFVRDGSNILEDLRFQSHLPILSKRNILMFKQNL